VIAFWKRRDAHPASEQERIIPMPKLSSPVSPSNPATKEQVERSRERLKVLKLERQIIGSAVATIYESHTNGSISTLERDRLLQKYKVDLGALEKTIDENQRIVDLYDLESAREELLKDFNAKIADIDERIKTLRAGNPPSRTASNPGNNASTHKANAKQTGDDGGVTAKDRQIVDAEKRIGQIREEILKAMDRLEQIESEG
jgi:hypothetical protein